MPKIEKMHRTAIYCRLSKEDGDKVVSNSIEGQIAYCKDFVNSQTDLKLVCEPLCDDGYSGVNLNRPAFEKLNLMVINRQIDCIVCKDLSRFTRDQAGGGEYLERILPQYGIRFIAINNCDTLKDDAQRIAFLVPVLNLINDNYCRDTSVKIRSSKETRQKRGDYLGATCPFGYKKSPEEKYKLVPDEGASKIVQLIFSLFKNGLCVQQVADELNLRGVLIPLLYRRLQGEKVQDVFQTKENPKWEYNTVKRILTNEAYVGVLIQKKTSSKNYKVRKQVPVPEYEQIRIENAVPSLISLDDFVAVQEMLARNTRTSPKEGNSNLLSGFVYCADCGATMIKKSQKPYSYFICSGHKKSKNCSTHSIRCGEVEERVLAAIHKQVEIIANMQKILDRYENETSKAWLSNSIDERIKELDQKIKDTMKLRLDLWTHKEEKLLNLEEYNQYRQEYNEDIERYTLEKEKLEKQSHDFSLTGTKSWSKLLKSNEKIDELNKNLLMTMVEKVLVYENHGLEIVFKCCDELAKATEYIAFSMEEEKIINL